jgi:hypothetical protein
MSPAATSERPLVSVTTTDPVPPVNDVVCSSAWTPNCAGSAHEVAAWPFRATMHDASAAQTAT